MVKAGSPALAKIGRVGQALGGGLLGHEAAKDAGLPEGVSTPIGLLSGYLSSKGLSPKKAAQKKVFEGVNPEDVKQRLDASRRLGLDYITPAEASLNPYAAAKQGSIGKTPEGSKALYQKGAGRVESEKKAINSLFKDIYDPKSMDPQKAKLYEETYSKSVSPEFIEKHSSKPIIETALKAIERDPVYRQKLDGVPKDSLAYWDQVKRWIGDSEQKSIRTGASDKARILGDTRKEMVSELDVIAPEYSEARSVAELSKTRQTLEKAFDRKDVTGSNFYRALASDDKFDKLMHSLRTMPEAQQKLKDMKLIFGNLIGTPTIKTASALEKTSMSKARGTVQSAEEMLSNIFGEKHDRAAVELMTNPKWDEILKNSKQSGTKKKALSTLVNILGKSSGQEAGKALQNKS